MIVYSGVVARMKIDDCSYETTSDEQIAIQRQGTVNGGRTGGV